MYKYLLSEKLYTTSTKDISHDQQKGWRVNKLVIINKYHRTYINHKIIRQYVSNSFGSCHFVRRRFSREPVIVVAIVIGGMSLVSFSKGEILIGNIRPSFL